MKIKTSVTISSDLLKKIDKISIKNRSAFIETALVRYFEVLKKEARNHKDLEIISINQQELNRESSEILNYQVNE